MSNRYPQRHIHPHAVATRPRNMLLFLDHQNRRESYTVLMERYGIGRSRVRQIIDHERQHFESAGRLMTDYIHRRGYESIQQVEFLFREWESQRAAYMMEVT